MLILNDVIIVLNKAHKDSVNKPNRELNDYKLWCFNGQAKIMLVCSERYSESGLHEDFFDMEWNHLALGRTHHPCSEKNIEKPECFELMQKLAGKLSCGIPFARVDFYEISGRVYFGEITFFPSSGFEGFIPDEWDSKIGSLICLRNT